MRQFVPGGENDYLSSASAASSYPRGADAEGNSAQGGRAILLSDKFTANYFPKDMFFFHSGLLPVWPSRVSPCLAHEVGK